MNKRRKTKSLERLRKEAKQIAIATGDEFIKIVERGRKQDSTVEAKQAAEESQETPGPGHCRPANPVSVRI